jgi:hypothetical protein
MMHHIVWKAIEQQTTKTTDAGARTDMQVCEKAGK